MKALSKTNKQLIKEIVGQGIIEAISDGVSIQDTNFHVLYQNKKAKKLMGDHVGECCYRAFDNGNAICSNCPMSKSFEDGKTHSVLLTKKTETRKLAYKITASPVKDTSGKIIAGIEVIKDLSVQKNLKKKKIPSVRPGSDWEEVFNSINDAITIHDADYNVIRSNSAAEKLLGCTQNEILNQKCFESYHGTSRPPEGCPGCKAMNNGLPTTSERFESRLNKYLEIKAFPRFDRNNKITGLVHVTRDITERKQLESERENLIFDLTDALFKVKTLSGLLPICASCKKIRDDNGYWKQVDEYIGEHSEAEFTHGICPDCTDKLFLGKKK